MSFGKCEIHQNKRRKKYYLVKKRRRETYVERIRVKNIENFVNNYKNKLPKCTESVQKGSTEFSVHSFST